MLVVEDIQRDGPPPKINSRGVSVAPNGTEGIAKRFNHSITCQFNDQGLSRFPALDGVNGLVRTYLHALNDAIDECNSAELPRVIDNFCRLLALACGGRARDQRVTARTAKLRQVKDYIALRLSEPDLTPARVAAAMKISVRQLHLLFEPTGISFAEYVLGRRLEECRAILESPSGRARSITDIAYAWGFNNLASFYRAFRRRFGVSPGILRHR